MISRSHRITTSAALIISVSFASSAHAQSAPPSKAGSSPPAAGGAAPARTSAAAPAYQPQTRAQGNRAQRDPGTTNQTAAVVPANSWSPGEEPPADRMRPPEADQKKEKPYHWDEHHGLFGPFRFGPVIGTGFPNVLNYGVTAKLWGYLGLGLNWGQTPDMQFSFYGKAHVSYREFDGYARVYPFRGGFFLGVGVGHHSVKGSIDNNFHFNTPAGAQDYGYTSVGSIRSSIITPQIGYFRNFAFGLGLGFDIGAQIPFKPSAITFDSTLASQVPAEYAYQAEKPVRDTLQSVGKAPIPAVNVRVGWLF